MEYLLQPDWPKLAWCATCDQGSPDVRVLHGAKVEVRQDWFGEIAWDGKFSDANFDQTDIVSGSGGRIRDGQFKFVSSGSVVDRLHVLQVDGRYYVSNSLPCLLSVSGSKLDPTHPRYYQDLRSINLGLDRYHRHFPCSNGQIEFVYFDNLGWDGEDLCLVPKPFGQTSFANFEEYHDYLVTTMARKGENIQSADRKFPFDMVATVSSGYDSTTVSAVATTGGCRRLLTIDRSRAGESDSGEEVGKYLGVDVHVADREAWRNQELAEIPFIAGGPGGGGSVFFKSAEDQLTDTVLFSGLGGGPVWGKIQPGPDGDYAPIGVSDCSLLEYRLDVGFLHCPLPLWGMRTPGDVYRISSSDEMRDWNVPGKYNRPVARRIVESAGVPRDAFGMKKRAAAFKLHQPFSGKEALSASSAASFHAWLRENRGEWWRRRKLPPSRILSGVVDNLLKSSDLALRVIYRLLPASRIRDSVQKQIVAVGHLARRPPASVRSYTFPWAVDRLQENYDASRSNYPAARAE